MNKLFKNNMFGIWNFSPDSNPHFFKDSVFLGIKIHPTRIGIRRRPFKCDLRLMALVSNFLQQHPFSRPNPRMALKMHCGIRGV